jgi:hypothetical protein
LTAIVSARRTHAFSKFARNSQAVILCDLDRLDEARIVLEDAEPVPRTIDDWVAAHILCMIEMREGATDALAARLTHLVTICPYHEQRLYFETTLTVVRIALKHIREARDGVATLLARRELDSNERAAVHLMEAHVEAVDGNLFAARRSIEAASNVVRYEEFELRRLRREIETRFGLKNAPALTDPHEIDAAEKTLVRLEIGFWIERASGRRRAA